MALTGVSIPHTNVLRFVREGHFYALEVVLKQVAKPISTVDLVVLHSMYLRIFSEHILKERAYDELSGHIERAKRIVKNEAFSTFVNELATDAGCRAH